MFKLGDVGMGFGVGYALIVIVETLVNLWLQEKLSG